MNLKDHRAKKNWDQFENKQKEAFALPSIKTCNNLGM